MKVHTLTIKRNSPTQGVAGGLVDDYTTAARGSKPTSIKGRAILMNTKEKLEHGVRGDLLGWKFLIPDTDPQIELTDQVTFTYIDGQSHTVEILVQSHARSVDGRFYKAIGQEKSTE